MYLAYKIEYDGQKFEQYKKTNVKTSRHNRTVLVFVFVIAMIICSIKSIRTSVLDYILPGDGPVTRQAANVLFQDLREGESFREAFADFCVEIFENA